MDDDADERADEQADADADADESADEEAAERAEAEAERAEAAGGSARAFDHDAFALVFAAGWDVAVDGQSPRGQHAPGLRAGVGFGRVELGAHVEAGLSAELQSDEAEVTLARRLALGFVAVELLRAADFRLAAALSAGAASFQRKTGAVAPGLRGTPERDTLAFAAGLEVRAGYTLIAGGGARLSLELMAGALLVPGAPVLRFDSVSPPREEPLWSLQPEIRLGPHLRVRL